MRTTIQLYDKHLTPIREGDLLKVYHFKTRDGMRHYMYKQVSKREGFLFGLHYPFKDINSGYDLQGCADRDGILHDCEIVDSDNSYPYMRIQDMFVEDRPKLKKRSNK